MRCVTYSGEEREIVELGLVAIQEVLMGTDAEKKCSLLLCLDKYLDPYFNCELSDKEEVIRLLETVIVSPNELDVVEDALNLLMSYAWGPFEILEKNFDRIPMECQGDAKYVISMHRVTKIEQLVLNECARIFNEAEGNSEEFPQEAIVVHSTVVSEEDYSFYKNISEHNIEMMWRFFENRFRSIGVSSSMIPSDSITNDRYYSIAEYYFNIDMDKREVCLVYYHRPREARCLTYAIGEKEKDEFFLMKPKVHWVS